MGTKIQDQVDIQGRFLLNQYDDAVNIARCNFTIKVNDWSPRTIKSMEMLGGTNVLYSTPLGVVVFS